MGCGCGGAKSAPRPAQVTERVATTREPKTQGVVDRPRGLNDPGLYWTGPTVPEKPAA